MALDQVERELVLAALERTGFVQKRAAALLRVSPRKLNYMVGRMGITHPSWRRHRGEASAGPGPDGTEGRDRETMRPPLGRPGWDGARGRTRTCTANCQAILSRPRLPIPPPGP